MTASGGKMPLLYSYWRSSCSYRVRIALNLKEIEYDMKLLNITKQNGEHRTEEYQKINPMQKIPALQIDGITIVESLNIMHYLEETRPQHKLMPTGFTERAKVREICEMIQSGIQPLQNMGVLASIESLAGKEKKIEWTQYWINCGLGAVEKTLEASAGKYCVGDKLTLADCCLIPQVYNAKRYKINLKQFPIILRIDNELEDHPAFHAAHPRQQPDCNESQAK